MKFTEYLFAHSVSEWRKQYLLYEGMKRMLYNALKEAPDVPQDVEEVDVSSIYFANFHNKFFSFCQEELKKINGFYAEKLAEARETLGRLRKELEILRQLESTMDTRRMSLDPRVIQKQLKKQFADMTGNKTKKKLRKEVKVRREHLKLALSEFYLSLILLQNYQQLNHTGFRKILKKHDKLLNTKSGSLWFQDEVEDAQFYTNKEIDSLIVQTENVVTENLEGGNRSKAMKQLRVIPLEDQQSPWTVFKVGFFSGALVVLVTLLVLTGIFEWSQREDWSLVFRLYRAPLVLVSFTLLLGINIYGWRSSGVNHVLIFELDPRNHLSDQQLFELATLFGLFWSISVLSFVYSSSNDSPMNWPPYINPLTLLIILFIVFMVNPTQTCSKKARFWFLSVMGRIILAPFFEVKFADFWLADQLNSLAPIFLDLQYSICLYVNYQGDLWTAGGGAHGGLCRTDNAMSIWIRFVLSCLPAWFRFMQCLRRYRDTKEGFPHLANAAKYSTTFFVQIFANLHLVFEGDHNGTFFYLWIVSSLVSSTFCLTWDIHMDWGFLEKSSPQNKRLYLRAELVYPYRILYYLAAIQNVILRFAWMFSYFLVTSQYIRRDSMLSITTALEIYRRFVWNFFRLENEHLNNCGKFRAVRDISLAHLADPRHVYVRRQSVAVMMD